jgi:hypothetical protein
MESKKQKFVVFVNGDKFEFDTDQVKVGTLIEDGGGVPGQYELQQRDGEHGPVIATYTDPNQVITIKNGEDFTTRFIGPINPA